MGRKVASILLLFAVSAPATAECVILLHGLARTASAMEPMASALAAEGYTVVNVDYPSREKPVEELAPLAVGQGLAECEPDEPVNFVTHSLGGILVRYYMQHHGLERFGRAVMLAPPNGGSEVVDDLRGVPGFELINGPAGLQLGTDPDSIPSNLGPVDYEVGVIAGTETFNPILSQSLPNPDDGKVSVESTKVEGMSDFLTVPHSHPFIMRADPVISQTLLFLRTGKFDHTVQGSQD